MNKVDYYLDFKNDGTYDTYASNNPQKSTCFWRAGDDHFESVCKGSRQKNGYKYAKVNDLKNGKPTIMLDATSYYPVSDKPMWQ